MSIQKKVLKKGPFNYGQDTVIAFSAPIVGCLVKKGLQKKGGSRAPQDPPGYALEAFGLFIFKKKSQDLLDLSLLMLQ